MIDRRRALAESLWQIAEPQAPRMLKPRRRNANGASIERAVGGIDAVDRGEHDRRVLHRCGRSARPCRATSTAPCRLRARRGRTSAAGPVVPQRWLGEVMEPSVSVPIEKAHKSAAVAEAGTSARSARAFVRGSRDCASCRRTKVVEAPTRRRSSCRAAPPRPRAVCSRPSASLSGIRSRYGSAPQPVATPFVSNRSFSRRGCRAAARDRRRPRSFASAASASASASSGVDGRETFELRAERRDAREVDLGQPAAGQRARGDPLRQLRHRRKGDIGVVLRQRRRRRLREPQHTLCRRHAKRAEPRIEARRRGRGVRQASAAARHREGDLPLDVVNHLVALGLGVRDPEQPLRGLQIRQRNHESEPDPAQPTARPPAGHKTFTRVLPSMRNYRRRSLNAPRRRLVLRLGLFAGVDLSRQRRARPRRAELLALSPELAAH